MELFEILRALWRKKWLLAAVSIVPSLAFGLFLYFSPRVYQTRIEYHIETDSVSLHKIHARFYSTENMDRIIGHLEAAGLKEIPAKLRAAESDADLSAMIRIKATPDYIDFANKKNLKISLAKSWAENVEKLEKLTAELLYIEIRGKPKEEVERLAGMIQTNFEKELPIYDLRDTISKRGYDLNKELSAIEGNRQPLYIALEELKKTLVGLKQIPIETGAVKSDINLHYQDPAQQARFLPLPYQIQAAASEVNRVTQAIEAADRRHAYFSSLKSILNQLSRALTPDSNTAQNLDAYRNFVLELLAKTESPGQRDYLNLHLNLIDTYNQSRIPLSGQGRIQPLAKDTIRKTLFMFIALAIIGIFVVSLYDYLRRCANGTEPTES